MADDEANPINSSENEGEEKEREEKEKIFNPDTFATPAGQVEDIDLSIKMESSFLDYAMSVIVARALPDVRDGLKPVHRRVLYDLHELGIGPDKPYKKAARIVGDVLGKFHPHGDTSVYDAMVRMAQDFSYRYMLIDGHGNFGSVDGDGAAAMRYTEVRLSKIAVEMLRNINKDTVNMHPNYDGDEQEPEVLPSRIPNLLVNGASGIAVGMATNIPPHNLSEVIEAIHILMKNPNATTLELMRGVKGPDFPTGGVIIGKAGIRSAYETGRGKITVRAKVDIEDKHGKQRIIITELPYMVNKAKLVERIAGLSHDKERDNHIEGISSVNDESDQEGMRVVIEISREGSAEVVLNNLYKNTQMQTSFSFNMLAIVNGKPEVLSLKSILEDYLKHQHNVIKRRTEFNLKRDKARLHILSGLLIALNHINEVIKIIRTSPSGDEAKAKLIADFKLSDKQAQAILDMRLVRLTGLELNKVQEEYDNLIKRIKEEEAILASDERINQIIYNELLEIQERFGDKRRTELRVGELTNLEDADLIDNEEAIIFLTNEGYVKRISPKEFKQQNRGGRGIEGMKVNSDDNINKVLSSKTHDTILFITNLGRVFRLHSYEIPEYGRSAKGLPLVNLLELNDKEKVTGLVDVGDVGEKRSKNEDLFFVTKLGNVKRMSLSNFKNVHKRGIHAISLLPEDEVVNAFINKGNKKSILLGTSKGYTTSFKVSELRKTGRMGQGVKGIRLAKGDHVVSGMLRNKDEDIITISENGYGKKTLSSAYSINHRGGRGIKAFKLNDKTGKMAVITSNDHTKDLLLSTNKGTMLRLKNDDISFNGRVSSGSRMIKPASNSKLVSSTFVDSKDVNEADSDKENESKKNISEKEKV